MCAVHTRARAHAAGAPRARPRWPPLRRRRAPEYPVGVRRVPCGSTQSTLWEYSERCGSLARSRLCWLPLRRYPVATQHIILQHSTPCCSTVQHVAAQHIMLQHSTLCCSTGSTFLLQHAHHVAAQRSAAQRSAPRCDAVDEHVARRRCIVRCIHCGGTSAHCAVALPRQGTVPCGH